MGHSLVGQAATAFGAGLLSSLSPCVYPMIPISLGFLGSQTKGHRAAVVLFFIGQLLAFTALGVFAVKLGEVFGFSHELAWVNLLVGVVIVGFGVSSFMNYIPGFLNHWNGLAAKLHGAEVHDYVLPLLIGVGSALLASPCTSPILGTVLLALSKDGTFERGFVLMFFYALGISLLFLLLGMGLLALDRMPRIGRAMQAIHKLSSVLIVATGVYYISRAF